MMFLQGKCSRDAGAEDLAPRVAPAPCLVQPCRWRVVERPSVEVSCHRDGHAGRLAVVIQEVTAITRTVWTSQQRAVLVASVTQTGGASQLRKATRLGDLKTQQGMDARQP